MMLLLGSGSGRDGRRSGRARGGAGDCSRRFLGCLGGLGLGLRLGLGGCGLLGGGDGLGLGLGLGDGLGLCLGHLFGFGFRLSLGPLVVARRLVARIFSHYAGGGWQLDDKRSLGVAWWLRAVSVLHTQSLIPAGKSRLLEAIG